MENWKGVFTALLILGAVIFMILKIREMMKSSETGAKILKVTDFLALFSLIPLILLLAILFGIKGEREARKLRKK
jgi:Na+/H+ antiporter NhaC|tara:strand:+ start:626 stop:850 length:225 start_codon:yes stop_codon:yes gene_type:complete